MTSPAQDGSACIWDTLVSHFYSGKKRRRLVHLYILSYIVSYYISLYIVIHVNFCSECRAILPLRMLFTVATGFSRYIAPFSHLHIHWQKHLWCSHLHYHFTTVYFTTISTCAPSWSHTFHFLRLSPFLLSLIQVTQYFTDTTAAHNPTLLHFNIEVPSQLGYVDKIFLVSHFLKGNLCVVLGSGTGQRRWSC